MANTASKATAIHELRLRNIYVLPTLAGIMLGVSMFILLIASINFRLNLGYALTFLIGGSAFASIFTAYRTLKGTKLSTGYIPSVFTGQNLVFNIILENPDPRIRYGIGVCIPKHQLRYHKNQWVWCDILPQESTIISLSVPTKQRGWQQIPKLMIQTSFPMGVFRAWSIWQPLATILIYPKIESDPPALPINSAIPDEQAHNKKHQALSYRTQNSEYDSIRPYRAGDPIKQIYWKKVQSDGRLLSKEGASQQSQDLWLTLESTGLSNLEQQLSRLTAWVLLAHQQNTPYGLQLGATKRIYPSLGREHQIKCLETLATYLLPDYSSYQTQSSKESVK